MKRKFQDISKNNELHDVGYTIHRNVIDVNDNTINELFIRINFHYMKINQNICLS